MVEISVVISIGVMVATILYVLGRDMYRRLVMPFMCYKFVIFDQDDEYTFYEKKKRAVVREGIKGFELFRKKGEDGEFYTLPLDKAYGDVNDKYSKRDDRGFVTYYYYRNNNTPIQIIPDHTISMVTNDARASTKILKTTIFDSAVAMDEHKPPVPMWLLIAVGAVILVAVLFGEQIKAALGGG